MDTDKEAVKMNYLSMIRSAKKKIRIQSPYFIPDASVLDALKTAASGVEVEMMIPGIQASFFLDPVTTYYAGQLLEFGAKIYKYQGYIHAKTMTIDEELCCIGSVNMDMRSLMVDDEICGIFYANDLVQDYIRIFEEDIRRCDPYSYKGSLHRGRREKLAEGGLPALCAADVRTERLRTPQMQGEMLYEPNPSEVRPRRCGPACRPPDRPGLQPLCQAAHLHPFR